jgi:hypothetical protein
MRTARACGGSEQACDIGAGGAGAASGDVVAGAGRRVALGVEQAAAVPGRGGHDSRLRARGGAASRARGYLTAAAPGAGRPRLRARSYDGARLRVDVRAPVSGDGALPRLTGGVRLHISASARRSWQRPATGHFPLGTRLCGCRGTR